METTCQAYWKDHWNQPAELSPPPPSPSPPPAPQACRRLALSGVRVNNGLYSRDTKTALGVNEMGELQPTVTADGKAGGIRIGSLRLKFTQILVKLTTKN